VRADGIGNENQRLLALEGFQDRVRGATHLDGKVSGHGEAQDPRVRRGIQFTLPELASAIEANAPIIILLWNNRGYGEIKRYMRNRSIPEIGVDIYTPDLLLLAQAFGCNATRAESLSHLNGLLRAAMGGDRPSLIESSRRRRLHQSRPLIPPLPPALLAGRNNL
jgi:hypothetical protein